MKLEMSVRYLARVCYRLTTTRSLRREYKKKELRNFLSSSSFAVEISRFACAIDLSLAILSARMKTHWTCLNVRRAISRRKKTLQVWAVAIDLSTCLMQLKIRRNNLKTFSKQSLKDKSHKELFVIFSVDANSINGRTASHKKTESLHQSVVERIDVINRVLDVSKDKSLLIVSQLLVQTAIYSRDNAWRICLPKKSHKSVWNYILGINLSGVLSYMNF